MVTADSSRKAPRSRNPFRLLPSQPGRPPDSKADFLRADLFDLLRKLQLTLTVVMAAVRALEHQAAEQDEDIAQLLKRYVCDALGVEIEKWEAIMRAQRRAGKTAAH